MQYFVALKIGEKRVKDAQEFLSKYIDSSNPAMPALALKDNKTNIWDPVGEENFFAIVKSEQGYLIAICDKNGIAKSIANWFSEEKKIEIENNLKTKGGLEQYFGNVSLPV
ncbi:MAG: hypothetical protein H0X03_06380 [Nitrosopumilus sp.]|nr:hypothetical protein [Nitrosopumilus sp.]